MGTLSSSKSSAKRSAAQDVSPSSARPLARFAFADVSASVFAKELETKDGKTVTVYNTSLQRRYVDADRKVKYSHSLRSEDLLPASLALMKSYEFIEGARQSSAA